MEGSRAERKAKTLEISASVPDPDHAWRVLALVNEWIRHADSKAAVTLAFTGGLGTVTFNLLGDSRAHSTFFDTVVVSACGLIAVAGTLCGLALTPRTRDRGVQRQTTSPLFFASITSTFGDDREGYAKVLCALTSDPDALTSAIADQVHANAKIATVKSRYAKWAIRSALFAGATVSLLAVLVGFASG